MTVVVCGMVADADGLVHQQEFRWAGRAAEVRQHYYRLPGTGYRKVQARDIPLDQNHSGKRVGSVLYLERQKNGSLWAVAEAEHNMLFAVAERDRLRFSPSIQSNRGSIEDGDSDIQLLALSVVPNPGSIGLPVITVLPRALDAGDWPYRTRHRELLERAASYHRSRRYGRPGPLTISTAPDALTRYVDDYGRTAGWTDELGDPIPVDNHRTDSEGRELFFRPAEIISIGGKPVHHR
jgi:hypothetical protein